MSDRRSARPRAGAGAQPRARRPVDARHLVGHRLGRDAAGLRRGLQPGASARLPGRVRRRRLASCFPARPACRPAASAPASGSGCGSPMPRPSASCRWSRRGARSTCSDVDGGLGHEAGQLPRPGVAPAYGTMRTQPAAAGRFIDAEDVRLQRRVGVPRQRGGAEAVRHAARRSARPSASTGMAFEVIGVQKEKVQLSNYGRPDKESVFIPLHDRRPAVEHRVPEHVHLPGDGSDARRRATDRR